MFLTVADLPGRAEWIGEPQLVVVPCIRHEVDALLRRWAVSDVVAEEAGIVVGELLANVVAHAQTTFRLEVKREGRLLYVAVEDGGIGVRPVVQPKASVRLELGLRLVSALALQWGWDEHPRGKTVWAAFLVD
jgi:anti-sigma regulatory factor (Ser/Thr protein kinase)